MIRAYKCLFPFRYYRCCNRLQKIENKTKHRAVSAHTHDHEYSVGFSASIWNGPGISNHSSTFTHRNSVHTHTRTHASNIFITLSGIDIYESYNMRTQKLCPYTRIKRQRFTLLGLFILVRMPLILCLYNTVHGVYVCMRCWSFSIKHTLYNRIYVLSRR